MKKTTPPAPPEKAPAPSREIEILREGRFTALDGQAVSFTAADLDELVSSYDADSDPAPIVIGHPKTDAPAWGWAKSLRVDGNILKATVDQLEPAFAEAVAAGRYKRVSASLYPRGHAASPKPAQLYLKHIGFLGGAAPAVKGLVPVAFSEQAFAGCITVEEGSTAVPEPVLSKAREVVAQPVEPREIAADVACLAEREAALSAREIALSEAEERIRNSANLAFAESLIAQVKLAPAAKDRVVFLLNALGATDDTLSFGEGDAAESAQAAFKSLLAAGHPVIALGEHAPAGGEFVDDHDGVSLGKRAQAFADTQRAKGISISAADAVRHVKKENQ